jgi:hypothetical protein
MTQSTRAQRTELDRFYSQTAILISRDPHQPSNHFARSLQNEKGTIGLRHTSRNVKKKQTLKLKHSSVRGSTPEATPLPAGSIGKF